MNADQGRLWNQLTDKWQYSIELTAVHRHRFRLKHMANVGMIDSIFVNGLYLYRLPPRGKSGGRS